MSHYVYGSTKPRLASYLNAKANELREAEPVTPLTTPRHHSGVLRGHELMQYVNLIV